MYLLPLSPSDTQASLFNECNWCNYIKKTTAHMLQATAIQCRNPTVPSAKCRNPAVPSAEKPSVEGKTAVPHCMQQQDLTLCIKKNMVVLEVWAKIVQVWDDCNK